MQGLHVNMKCSSEGLAGIYVKISHYAVYMTLLSLLVNDKW